MADACCDPGGAVDHRPDTAGAGAAGSSAVVQPQLAVWRIRELQLAALSGLFLIAGAAAPPSVVETGLFWVAAAAGGVTFVPGAVKGLVRGRLGVGLLMTIAAVGALLLGESGEAATLAFLFSIAEGLEGYALARTQHGLRALLSLAPARALVFRGGGRQEVDVAELSVGDRLLVRPGDKIATDGVVRSGRTTVDTSVVTGESVPVEAGPGDEVFAATVNGTGSIEVEVTATVEDNSLARLVHVVQEAQERKGASQRLAERVARPLVPGVLILATGIGVIGGLLGSPEVWTPRALVVLVAAAPCAFALSVPIAVVAAIGAGSKAGVLIKGGAAVEALGQIRVVGLDKTGTLTRNDPVVIETVPAAGVTANQVLAVAAGLEERSEHPLAAAILQAAPQTRPAAADVRAVPGQGVTGTIDGEVTRLGKPGFIAVGDLGVDVRRLQDQGATVVLIERAGRLIGAIGVRDEIRPEAAEAIRGLREQGITVAMLTGDNARTAAAIGERAGIDQIHAELSPEDKADLVTRLGRDGRVAMVGDGINDAPALATAHVGIAMGAMGSDVAVETADVALMGEDLRRLSDTFAHARASRQIFTQNLILSTAILVALVPLAAFGVLGLATVVATHELAEVIVILNGIRAGRKKHLPTRPATMPAVTPAGAGSGRGDPLPVVAAPSSIDVPSQPAATASDRTSAPVALVPLASDRSAGIGADPSDDHDDCTCAPGCDCCNG